MDDLLFQIQSEVVGFDPQLKFGLRLMQYQGVIMEIVNALSAGLQARIREFAWRDKPELFRRIQSEIHI